VRNHKIVGALAISIEGPSGPKGAVIIKHAYMGALALHAKLLCGTNCEGHRLAAVGALYPFGGCALNDPYIVVAYDIVSSA
jgi:hypothetical protein